MLGKLCPSRCGSVVWSANHPLKLKVVGSIPRQGTNPGFRLGPLGMGVGGNRWMFLSPFVSLNIS